METLRQDIKYGLRSLVKKPGFAIVAVFTLALGIGANTAIFSAVYGVLMRPLPYKDPDRLALIWTRSDMIGLEQNWVSEPELLDLREQSKLFEGFAAVVSVSVSLTGSGEPEQLQGIAVSSNFLSVLGLKAAMGRDFLPDEEKPGAPDLIMISDGLWKRRFGSDPDILGKSIILSGKPHSIIGVMPKNFALLLPKDAHVPADIDLIGTYNVDYSKQDRLSHGLTVIGRLKPGAALKQAQDEMDGIAARLYPLYYTSTGFELKVVSLHGDVVAQVRPALLVLLGAVGFVLLIACANVANLLLARASSREREFAVRAALGAGRWRIVRQLLTESVMLALAGGTAGLLVAIWGVDALLALRPEDLPRADVIEINVWALGFTVAVAILTGFIFGLAPALQVSKPDLTRSLKEGAKSVSGSAAGGRIRNAIVVAEVALSLVLLVGAGLMVRSFLSLQRVDAGFDPKNVLTMKLQASSSKYKEREDAIDFYKRLLERVKGLPGVESAAAISHLPLSNEYWSSTYTFEDVEREAVQGNAGSFEADSRVVMPDYFKTMKTPLVAGRFFTESDIAADKQFGPRVCIIDETLARRLWPNENPIGKRASFGRFPTEPKWFEIVGVVKHIRHHRLDSNVREQVYFPHAQMPFRSLTLVVRTASDPLNMIGAVRGALRELDADQPVYKIRTMEELVGTALAPARFTLTLVMIFALTAMALATVGIYGVISYTSEQRTHEIGIRMALGAGTEDILKLVIGQGMALALTGVAAGIAGALILTRVLKSLLYGVSATDPATFIGVSLLLIAAALAACYVPARRAMKIDPMTALRYE